MPDPTRRSLHLGVDAPDPGHYGGVVRSLAGAENDARRWQEYLDARGWTTRRWVGERATTDNLAAWVRETARSDAESVVITWSGHGAQVGPDAGLSLPSREDDDYDELWVMYDRFLFDDEVFELMASFRASTRVVVVADCCHSGTSFRIGPRPEDEWAEATQQIPRALGDRLAERIVVEHRDLYRGVVAALDPTTTCQAEFVGLAACRDNELAYESAGQGAFTRALLSRLEQGDAVSYAELVEAATAGTPYQHPRPFWYDTATLLHSEAFA